MRTPAFFRGAACRVSSHSGNGDLRAKRPRLRLTNRKPFGKRSTAGFKVSKFRGFRGASIPDGGSHLETLRSSLVPRKIFRWFPKLSLSQIGKTLQIESCGLLEYCSIHLSGPLAASYEVRTAVDNGLRRALQASKCHPLVNPPRP